MLIKRNFKLTLRRLSLWWGLAMDNHPYMCVFALLCVSIAAIGVCYLLADCINRYPLV